jgi:acyl phosphate:glycerol-3-phosphate acyltransferase
MSEHPIIASLIGAYLLGSIPFGYILVRVFYGADVRETGSGNIGATNVSRTSPLLGILTLVLDALKGTAAVLLVLLVIRGDRTAAFAAAFAAITGHIFPVWLRFRGGKGVATGLGSFLLLTPKAVLLAIGIFVAVFAVLRWVALASIVASASIPPLAWAVTETRPATPTPGRAFEHSMSTIVWLTAGAVLIIAKHHSNIRRMLAGQEPRFHLARNR